MEQPHEYEVDPGSVPLIDTDERLTKVLPALTSHEAAYHASTDMVPTFVVWDRGQEATVLDDPHLFIYYRDHRPEMLARAKYLAVKLPGWEDAVRWAITTALHRRHFNDWQRIILALAMKEEIAAEARARQSTRGAGIDARAKLPKAGTTRERIAMLAKTGERSVTAVETILEAIHAGKIQPEKRTALEEGRATIWGVIRELKARFPQRKKAGADARGSGFPASLGDNSVSAEIPWSQIADDKAVVADQAEALIDLIVRQFADYKHNEEISLTLTISWGDAPGASRSRTGGHHGQDRVPIRGTARLPNSEGNAVSPGGLAPLAEPAADPNGGEQTIVTVASNPEEVCAAQEIRPAASCDLASAPRVPVVSCPGCGQILSSALLARIIGGEAA